MKKIEFLVRSAVNDKNPQRAATLWGFVLVRLAAHVANE